MNFKETIFDHHISLLELQSLHILHYSKEEYIENNSELTILMDLYSLYAIRIDREKAEKYLRQYLHLISE